jgi:nucleotide-binding universal stress UspA family protein
MRKILVAVDAAAESAAVAEAVRLYAQEPVDVHLLNVQPAVSGHVAMFFSEADLHALHEAAGEEVLAPARAVLQQHHVPCSSSVRVGRCAETIVRTARELGCDRIVMGHHEPTAAHVLATKVLGSVVQQVRQLVRGGADCQVIGA